MIFMPIKMQSILQGTKYNYIDISDINLVFNAAFVSI